MLAFRKILREYYMNNPMTSFLWLYKGIVKKR